MITRWRPLFLLLTLPAMLAGCGPSRSEQEVAAAKATLATQQRNQESPAWKQAEAHIWDARAWVAEHLALARTDRAELSAAYTQADGNYYRQAVLRDLHDALVGAERDLVAAHDGLHLLLDRLGKDRKARPGDAAQAAALDKQAAELRASAETAEAQRAGASTALSRLRGW